MFFSSKDSKTAIDNAIAMHFVRSGREHLADVFIRVSVGNGGSLEQDTRTALTGYLGNYHPRNLA